MLDRPAELRRSDPLIGDRPGRISTIPNNSERSCYETALTDPGVRSVDRLLVPGAPDRRRLRRLERPDRRVAGPGHDGRAEAVLAAVRAQHRDAHPAGDDHRGR